LAAVNRPVRAAISVTYAKTDASRLTIINAVKRLSHAGKSFGAKKG
jgi:hypothetical protein